MTHDRVLVRPDPHQVMAPLMGWGTAGLVALVWMYLNRASLQWLMVGFQEIHGLHGLMLLAGLLLLAIQGVRYRRQIQLAAVPEFYPAPLLLLTTCGGLAIALQQWIDLEQIVAILFLLGLYGLVGLFLSPVIWRRGLVVAVAIACIIPFGLQFNTGLGFPARILTAHAVESILKGWHLAALSSEDIIVLDTGVARVDSPCSGLKSLWTGTLFLLVATWLERRTMGLRWLGVAIANLGVLVAANVGRVLTLVVLTHVLKQPALAEMMHVPLGVIGFITACGMAAVLLRWVPRRDARTRADVGEKSGWLWRAGRSSQVIPLLVCLGLLTLVPLPSQGAIAPSFKHFALSPDIQTQVEPLTVQEKQFFADYPDVTAQKLRFQDGSMTGALLLIHSPTWRAHHTPEACLLGSGYTLDGMEQRQFSEEITGRWISLNQGTRSAAYWFQSPQGTTDEFFTRLWSQVTRRETSWTLVSILFDQAYEPMNSGVQTFLETVQSGVERSLQASLTKPGQA